jgi:DNA sulfur modification protein DndD
MIFSKLKLHNFGVYSGLQEMDFSPGGIDQSIIVVGALNGSGKTTLLTAIQLVLYGSLTPEVKSKSNSYEEYLRSKINRSKNYKDGASVALDFSVFDDEGERQYSIKRFWKENKNNKVREELTVHIDGKYNKFLTENWAEHIEVLLPVRIMPLFFFDGEKIEELADEAHTSEILSSAVKSLLGLDLVDQLTSDLGVFDLKKKKAIATNEELDEISTSQDLHKKFVSERSVIKQEQADIVSKLEHQKNKHQEVIAEYSAQGGELFEKREELKLQRNEAVSIWTAHAEEIAKLSESASPLTLVHELLEEVSVQSDLEEVSEKAEAVLELLSIHDKKTLGKLTELSVDDEKVESISAFLVSERNAHESAASQECYLSLSKNGRDQLHLLNKSVLAGLGERITNELEVNSKLSDKIDQLEKLLLAVPESDAIRPFLQKVEDSEKKVSSLEDKLSYFTQKVNELNNQISIIERQLSQQLRASVDVQLEKEDATRFLNHSEKVKETLSIFKQRVLERKLKQLEVLILECFGELTRKDDLISELSIDSSNFELLLRDTNKNSIKTSDLSSGERQLLATSILWGLSKASQRRIPAIIDTPLGRLDSTHRGTLCESYFPKASHQVILLSTDEEVDGRYLKILKPSVNKTYKIEFDEEIGGSALSEGYLF